MKQTKQRVIAIDYFRGLCILMVLINHSWIFSMPFAYFTGAGAMWTSAAELFFLLSGITVMTVRGPSILENFKNTTLRLWRRSAIIYCVYLITAFILLFLVYLLPKNVSAATIGGPPITQGFKLLWQILTFQYTIGLANFLIYYTVYLIISPWLLKAILSRVWLIVLSVSAGLYLLVSTQYIVHSYFLIWQLYFVLGLVIGRFRLPIVGWFYGRSEKFKEASIKLVTILAATSIAVSCLIAFNIYPIVSRLVLSGLLPHKFILAYHHLITNSATLNLLFINDRLGVLRPVSTLVIFAAGYLLYQKHKDVVLKRTGSFVNQFGRDTLMVFVAQAIVIPILAALPLQRNLASNFVLTTSLVGVMWAVVNRRRAYLAVRGYIYGLRTTYYEAKNSYLESYEEV